MRPARRTIVAVMLSAALLTTALTLGAATGARAHDSHAPAGAAHNWLPSEGWVFQHWLPFDERALSRSLGASATSIRLWLRDDHHTLSMLARRRGIREAALLHTLTDRWRGRIPTARYRELRIRTAEMLTQGHLAQHVLFHVFHGPGIPTAAPAIFGVSRDVFLAARQAGFTPLQIATAKGRTEASVRASILRLLRATAARGVWTRSTTSAQAGRILGRQREQLHCWLTHALPKLDMANPYGDPSGRHHAGHACWEDA
jgi:hypothetical protein